MLFQTEAPGLPTPKGPIFFPEDAAFEGFLTVCGFFRMDNHSWDCLEYRAWNEVDGSVTLTVPKFIY